MEFISILAHTSRSQAYLQTLIKNKFFPKSDYLDDQNKEIR